MTDENRSRSAESAPQPPRKSRYVIVSWVGDDKAVLDYLETIAEQVMRFLIDSGAVADPSVSMGPGSELTWRTKAQRFDGSQA